MFRSVVKITITLLIVVAIAACDSLNRDQLLIHISAGVADTSWQAADLKRTLARFALDRGFTDITSKSKAVATLARFESHDEHFPMYLGARAEGDELLVDLYHFHPGTGETKTYSKLKADVKVLLAERYGKEVRLLTKTEYREGKRIDDAPNQ